MSSLSMPVPQLTITECRRQLTESLLPILGDCQLYPDIGHIIADYAQSEPKWQRRFTAHVTYSDDERTCKYTQDLYDVLIMMLDQQVSGRFLWELNILGKFDEMWCGVTTDAFIHQSPTTMLYKRNSFLYYGGRQSSIRRHRPGNANVSLRDGPVGAFHVGDYRNVLPGCPALACYQAGDRVGLLIDVPKGTMTLYCNDKEQFHFKELPTDKPLYFITELDAVGDEFTISCRDADAYLRYLETLKG